MLASSACSSCFFFFLFVVGLEFRCAVMLVLLGKGEEEKEDDD